MAGRFCLALPCRCPNFSKNGRVEPQTNTIFPRRSKGVGHLTDTERIFGYRALRIARGDTTPLPGFDENADMRVPATRPVPHAPRSACTPRWNGAAEGRSGRSPSLYFRVGADLPEVQWQGAARRPGGGKAGVIARRGQRAGARFPQLPAGEAK